MSVDELVDEREHLIEEWDEATEDYLDDLKDYGRLAQQRSLIHAEMSVLKDVYGTIAAAGALAEGEQRHALTSSAMVAVRLRYAYEREIIEAMSLMRKAGDLQHLVERHQAVLSELGRLLSRQYRDELETFRQLAAMHAEFAQRQLANSHELWRDAWNEAIEAQQMVSEQLERLAPGSAATWRFQTPPDWPPPHPGWAPQPGWLPDPGWGIPKEHNWHFWTRG
ncbi:hypothetical protein ACIBF1_36160 [Spirillospora sp. NPDC050679]